MSDIEALLEERRGYAMRGLTSRVAQVDAAIEALGPVRVADAPLADEVETAAPATDPDIETAAPPPKTRRGK